jgi:hypothetical protein
MKSRESAGYTIVEVLIVLAVTSALFISAAATMSGKQGRTEFLTGLRSMESKIQSVSNEVSAGFYDNGYQCRAPGGGPPQLNRNVTVSPGSNIDCVFLGKVMHFGLNSGRDYNVYTVVGRRATSTGAAVTTLAEAQPTAIDGTGTAPDVTEYKRTDWGVAITKILVKGTPDIQVGGFGYLNQLTGDIAGGNPTTGSRSLELVGVSGTTLASAKPAFVSRIQSTTPTPAMVDAPRGIVICVTGRNGQKGEIDVGGARGRLTTNVLMDTAVSSDC